MLFSDRKLLIKIMYLNKDNVLAVKTWKLFYAYMTR